MGGPLFSIIIPCKNEGGHIQETLQSIKDSSSQRNYEIIVVDDASSDGCCDFLKGGHEGITLLTTQNIYANRARNLGAKQAHGRILVFCDAHIFVEKDWLEKLESALDRPGVDAVSPCLKPHDYKGPEAWGGLTWEPGMNMRWLPRPKELSPVPVLTAGCLAITRKAFEAVEGFEDGFRVYGYEDTEFTLKLWLFGFGCYVEPKLLYYHYFRNERPYSLHTSDIYHNLLRMAFLHLNQQRQNKIIDLLKGNPYFAELLTEVVSGNVYEKRQRYLSHRIYDDDWFIKKFNISF